MEASDITALAARIEGAGLDTEGFEPILTVPPAEWRRAGAALEEGGWLLSDITAVDWVDTVDVVAHLVSRPARQMTLKTALPDGHLSVHSLTSVFPSADWCEREVYDLFGVVFEGHPDLRRILLIDDFEGHPLRKSWHLVEHEW